VWGRGGGETCRVATGFGSPRPQVFDYLIVSGLELNKLLQVGEYNFH